MTTREIAAEYRLSQWVETMRAHKASGKSITSFCESKGISRNTYFYWQRKIRAAICETMVSRNPTEDTTTEKSLVPRGWAMCKTEAPSSKSKSLTIEIGGWRILVEADTDPELLAKVCRTLVTIC